MEGYAFITVNINGGTYKMKIRMDNFNMQPKNGLFKIDMSGYAMEMSNGLVSEEEINGLQPLPQMFGFGRKLDIQQKEVQE